MIKKKLIMFSVLIMTLLALVGCLGCNNTNKVYATSSTNDYKITEYKVFIDVSEDNVYTIQESLTVVFLVEGKHGIYRDIPIYNSIKRDDGSVDEYLAEITDIDVTDDFTVDRDSGYCHIVIGNEDITIPSGVNKYYNISYVYNPGNDILKNGDEFYFNLIGTGWSANISNFQFRITMPKEFDTTQIQYWWGEEGEINYDETKLDVEITDNIIAGKFNETLENNNGFTIRITLPEGYYTKQAYSVLTILGLVVPIITLIGVVVAFVMKCKNFNIVKPSMFYPPKEMTLTDIILYYKGKVSVKDVSAYLVQLANLGCIRIIDNTTKDTRAKWINKSIHFEKLKDYTGDETMLSSIMQNLFMVENKIAISDVPTNFGDNIRKAVNEVNRSEKCKRIVETTWYYTLAFVVLAVANLLLMTFVPMHNMGYEMMFFAIVIVSAMLVTMCIIIKKYSTSFNLIFGIAFMAVLIIPLVVMAKEAFYYYGLQFRTYKEYLISFILCLLAVIVCFVLTPQVHKVKPKAVARYGEVLGFRQFLITDKKDELENLVEQNPEYFYSILPYAYVLGVSKKWIKKFENIPMQDCMYYDSRYPRSFGRRMHGIDHAVGRITSTVSSSSSGGSGGHSGGGGGGGGGGSW